VAFETGAGPLDQRTVDVNPGGLYLLSGPPDSAKLAALLQFLSIPLLEDGRSGLVTGSDPAAVLAQGERWGLPLEGAWRDGRLAILGFEGDFARRLSHAGRPEAVFDELGALLGPGISRIAIDPGSPLWETRADGLVGSRFLDWVEATKATVWATVGGSLNDRSSSSTEWVMQGARGILEFERSPDGQRQIWIRKLGGALSPDGPISVELRPGEGLTTPRGEPRRRHTDVGEDAARRLLLLSVSAEVPPDIEAWARSRFEVVREDDPLIAVETLGDGAPVGSCLVYLDRTGVTRAVQVCRTLRSVTPAPVVLVTDDSLRADDRTLALEAGADEVLDGGIHLPELERRLQRARSRPARGKTPRRREEAAGGEDAAPAMLDPEGFRKRLAGVLEGEEIGVFSFVLLRDGGDVEALVEAVRSQLRSESGDFASNLGDGSVGVVLWGVRAGQARAFLTRLRRALDFAEADALESEVLGSPADLEAIRSWASSS